MSEVVDQGVLPSRRERRAAETRERIFRAAIELIAERGLGNVTIEQITDRADVGKGTFFNYFPSKEAVLAYFGTVQVERLHEALERGEIEGSPAERALRILEIQAEHPGLTPDLARGLFISSLSSGHVSEVQGPSVWHVQRLLAGILREGQLAGEFRPEVDPDEAALMLFGQYFLGLLAWCTGFNDRPLPEVVRRYASFALEGLRRRPASG